MYARTVSQWVVIARMESVRLGAVAIWRWRRPRSHAMWFIPPMRSTVPPESGVQWGLL